MYQYESIWTSPKKHENTSPQKIDSVDWYKVVIRLFVYFF